LKDVLNFPIFKIISQLTSVKSVKAYVVGGYVRDVILKRPSKDIDIVVIGEGIDFAENVAKKLNINIQVFKNFGTAMIKYDGYEIEFVGARKESYRLNSRKPIVENATFEEDILRRDFTINAMAISLNKDDFGQLIDLHNGIQDLQNKLLKTPLEAERTFFDDPLRMMRAVRFASQLNFSLHQDVLNAIALNKKRIKIVSQERITDEFIKIIASSKPSIGLDLLFKSGLLEEIFPELARLQGVEFVGNLGHKDNFYHSIKVLDNVAAQSDNIWLRWAALLHDIAKPLTKRFTKEEGWTFHTHEFVGEKMMPNIFKKLKLPLNESLKYVQKLVRLHLRPIALTEEGITDSAVRRLLFDAGNDIDDLILLCKADITSKNIQKKKKYINNLVLVEKKLIEVEEKDKIREFQPPISGEEIIKIFGIEPSKEVGIIKNAIKDAILEGVIANNYEQAYHFMLDVAKKINLKPLKNE